MFYLVVINFFPLGDPSFEQQEKVCNLKLMRSQKVTRTICSFDSLINQLAVINFLASFLSPLIIVGGGALQALFVSFTRKRRSYKGIRRAARLFVRRISASLYLRISHLDKRCLLFKADSAKLLLSVLWKHLQKSGFCGIVQPKRFLTLPITTREIQRKFR